MVVRVEVYSDVLMVCLFHALSTEKEEVMGLLIGELEEDDVATISALFMMRRSDKQEDRVEISPEQLTAASIQAEKLAEELHRPLRVLGWYHSHPHITVWPSHVDVCTQANYQMMDSSFVGLIVSCFNQEGKHVGSPLMSHDIHVTLISYFLLYPLRSKKSRPLVSSQYIMELDMRGWKFPSK
jgi:BRCA1/BRCA2-containing complex subunit 3